MVNSNPFSVVKYEILETLQQQSISRVNLAKKLNLSKPTISENVAKLVDLGVVVEAGEGKAKKTGGRKPIILELNYSYEYIISIDLSFERPVCAVGNLSYTLLNEQEVCISEGDSTQARLDSITNTIESLIKNTAIEPKKIGVIVISTPGVIGEDGDYYFANIQFSKWTQIGLKQYLEEKYQIPVKMFNDVNLALIAEMEMGYGREYRNLIYISCGLGIGSGIALNRKIYEGEHFGAGEIGYFIDESTIQNGTNIEDLICLNSIIEKIKKDIKNGQKTLVSSSASNIEEIGFDDLVNAYEMNDPYIRMIFCDYIGKKLGIAIFNIVSLLDVGIVIFGGIYTRCSDEMFKGMKSVVSKGKFKEPKLKTSKFGSKGSTYGAIVEGTKTILKSVAELHEKKNGGI